MERPPPDHSPNSTNGPETASKDALASPITSSWASWVKGLLGETIWPSLLGLDAKFGPSEVHKARSRRTGALVALKKIIMHNEKDGVCG